MQTPRCCEANTEPVGAHEQREAAMAAYQTHRYRCLALLVSSYRKFPIQMVIFCLMGVSLRFSSIESVMTILVKPKHPE